jgi:hypothetical protein
MQRPDQVVVKYRSYPNTCTSIFLPLDDSNEKWQMHKSNHCIATSRKYMQAT